MYLSHVQRTRESGEFAVNTAVVGIGSQPALAVEVGLLTAASVQRTDATEVPAGRVAGVIVPHLDTVDLAETLR